MDNYKHRAKNKLRRIMQLLDAVHLGEHVDVSDGLAPQGREFEYLSQEKVKKRANNEHIVGFRNIWHLPEPVQRDAESYKEVSPRGAQRGRFIYGERDAWSRGSRDSLTIQHEALIRFFAEKSL
jgi:hypothetical protein